MNARAANLALNLLDLGLKPLDRVVVQLPNRIQFAYLYLALQKIGVIPVMALPAQHRLAALGPDGRQVVEHHRQLLVDERAQQLGHAMVDGALVIHQCIHAAQQMLGVGGVALDDPDFRVGDFHRELVELAHRALAALDPEQGSQVIAQLHQVA